MYAKTIFDLMRLSITDGRPTPGVPPALTGHLMTFVYQGLECLVLKGQDCWVLAPPPKPEHDGLALVYLFTKNAVDEWQTIPTVMDPRLECRTFFGEKPSAISTLDEDARLSLWSWIAHPETKTQSF